MFKLKEKTGIKYFQIEEFVETGLVKHCFTTRVGGTSQGEYASLNLGLHVGDEQQKVVENRNRVCQVLNSKLETLVAGEQVHGEQIKVVTAADKGKGAKQEATAIAGTDALITDQLDILLSSYYADCTPLFFLDLEQEVVGLAHAGWKGTVSKIAQKTVVKLEATYGSRPADLLVGVGPAIGSCCYQVDRKVVEPIKDNFREWKQLIEKVRDGQWKLDLKLANKLQLKQAGVQEKNIIVSKLCTACNQDLFYSYRREGTTGRMASFIKLS